MNNLVGVIVDAGHGGNDPGAVAGNLKEKDLTLKAAKYMYDRLRELGIDAELTRDSDTSLPKSERIKKVLSLYNNNPNVILVANHINAGGGEGAEIVYALRNDSTLADMALSNIKDSGQIPRGTYQRVLPEDPSKDYYYILRETGKLEPILVEYGFIDNSKDAYKLQNNLEDYVEGVVKAIADYAGIKYTPPGLSTDTNTYIVKKGDTLYKIANQFNTTVQELRRLNNLTSDTLYIGQTLKISESPVSTNVYIVKKGDTLYSIANSLGTTVDDLKRVNNLTSNTLTIGQQLLIPSSVTEPEKPPVTPPDDNLNYDKYTVKKGDSLWSISRQFDVPIDELVSINNLTNSILQIGDVLLIPKQNDTNVSVTYTVKSGDTLWSIAKKYNVSVDSIKNANNLSNNLLSIGQTIVIPK